MKPTKPIEFKGNVASFSALTVTLRSNDIEELSNAMSSQYGATNTFFSEDIALLDAEHLPDKGISMDWSALVILLRKYRLNPVIVRNSAAEAENSIHKAGLTLSNDVEISAKKPAPLPQETPTLANTIATTSAIPPPTPQQQRLSTALPTTLAETMVIDRPLRSGQQVYARNADLVVLAMVSPGAEVMADGNIHVYAPLRGRALAGANGNMNAHILTTCFEAELVSIGGVYRPLEPGMPQEVNSRPAHVRLTNDAKTNKQLLLIDPLKIS